jgi:spore coat-associated protein N
MSIKKKMGMSILAGALGVSLIGGGTWAAFNDVETTSNSFNAGTLDLEVGNTSTMTFNISNLKPGDYFTKKLVLTNNGSLSINDIKVHALKIAGTANSWSDVPNADTTVGTVTNTEDEFLSQFNIEIKKTTGGVAVVYNNTLAHLVSVTGVGELTGTASAVGAPAVVGLAPAQTNEYDVKVTFVPDSTTFNNSRLHVQNKYQGEKSNLQFVFEATQMPGENRDNN